jgi:hypothetical protein
VSPDDSAALDRQLAAMVRRSRRVLWTVIALAGLLFVGAIVYLVVQLRGDEARIAASCRAWADIGAAPLAAGPDGKASLLGTRIISDSREAWHGQACPGELPPPQPSFVHWARFYGLPYK